MINSKKNTFNCKWLRLNYFNTKDKKQKTKIIPLESAKIEEIIKEKNTLKIISGEEIYILKAKSTLDY